MARFSGNALDSRLVWRLFVPKTVPRSWAACSA